MLVAGATEALLEIDEMSSTKNPDGTITVEFITTGIRPKFVQIKTALWAIFGLPVQKIENVQVEQLQAGPITKRYKVTVTLAPWHKGVREGNFGLVDTIMGTNVSYIE